MPVFVVREVRRSRRPSRREVPDPNAAETARGDLWKRIAARLTAPLAFPPDAEEGRS